MTRCAECGLMERTGDFGERYCLKFRRCIGDGKGQMPGDCPYFTPIQYDGGEPLTPHQHLILKEGELLSKKMRGPV
ncbi:MAG: hypothetical protein D9V47_03480 [Clostridia bacterium]|nr:MAG: hypothetical protein D9V47_03480 [Clostridia bacterium]